MEYKVAHCLFTIELAKIANDMVACARESDRSDRDLAAEYRGRLWELCTLFGLTYLAFGRESTCESRESRSTPTRNDPPDT